MGFMRSLVEGGASHAEPRRLEWGEGSPIMMPFAPTWLKVESLTLIPAWLVRVRGLVRK